MKICNPAPAPFFGSAVFTTVRFEKVKLQVCDVFLIINTSLLCKLSEHNSQGNLQENSFPFLGRTFPLDLRCTPQSSTVPPKQFGGLKISKLWAQQPVRVCKVYLKPCSSWFLPRMLSSDIPMTETSKIMAIPHSKKLQQTLFKLYNSIRSMLLWVSFHKKRPNNVEGTGPSGSRTSIGHCAIAVAEGNTITDPWGAAMFHDFFWFLLLLYY